MNWTIKRIKDIKSSKANAFADGPFGSNLKTEHFVENGDVLVIDSGYITSGNFLIRREFKTISFEHFLTVKRSECKDGDLIIAKIGANFGMSAILPKLDRPSLVSGNTLKLTINDRLYFNKFIHYQFLNKKTLGEIDVLVKGSAQPALSMGLLNDIEFILPNNLSVQQAIANYLDTKTQGLDKKVSLLEQKIESFKKLKRTLINQTITKGLDKNVPLKDSDVSYISKIPSDWKIERIKDLFKIGRGRVIGQLELVEDGKYPVYSSQTENNGCLGYIDTYDFDGDLLTWTTDGANAGTVFRRSGKFNCTNVCGTLKPIRNNLDLNYMVYALQESAIHNKRIDTNGAKIMNNEMALIKVPLPPKSEQEEIAKYLDHKTATIDAIVSNIGKQIDTLKQLRKTLINDVVTGKIKVIE